MQTYNVNIVTDDKHENLNLKALHWVNAIQWLIDNKPKCKIISFNFIEEEKTIIKTLN